ncbi:DUF4145 domain-containing protein [Listeria seeligeri]|uniref:DUF4145 domain-containing protein n=1 Tax=Listeria seeligeri TaxID=1640 RepID=UPI001119DF56|nr:DUF4145 domain-containing protein [Listeria seeligeri]QDA74620.1 DUF4145 domain-containing protein [Listeria seeligeri]
MKMIKDVNEQEPYLGLRGDGIMENSYTCGYCNSHTSSVRGMALIKDKYSDLKSAHAQQVAKSGVYICTHCKMPTFIWEDIQVPGNKFGNPVEGVSETVNDIYEEARASFSVGAYTAVVLLCRKLLMNLAVDLKADENKNFAYYVNYLKDNHYIPVNSSDWVDAIRKHGNEATHETKVKTRDDAEKMIKFSEMLIKMNYEYPSLIS